LRGTANPSITPEFIFDGVSEKFEKLHNIFIKSNSESIQQEMDMVEMELKILREEKVNGIITRAKAVI
jgi:hypothetical protein